MKAFKHFLGILLLVLFTGYILPREWMHDLLHHEDTHDDVSLVGGDVRLDHPHQHCDVLKLQGAPFVLCYEKPKVIEASFCFVYRLPVFSIKGQDVIDTADLRGPPAVLA